MKKLTLIFILTCCMLNVAAQDSFKVNYQGARPMIKDFVKAFIVSLDLDNVEECDAESMALYKNLQHAIGLQEKGQPLDNNETLTIDTKNGFLCYEWAYEESSSKIEMCYWNEADGKHKLFAVSRWCFVNGKPSSGQYDGMLFYRYNNATRKMTSCEIPGFNVEYFNKSYALPRVGKDIIVTTWHDSGTKTQKSLKWNGHGFNYDGADRKN